MIRRLLVVSVLLAPVSIDAQALQSIRLKPSNANLAEEFTALTSVRELSDGRLLLTDRRQQRVVVANLQTGVTTTVGSRGHGPGEYASPPQVFHLAGDSSLLVARTQRRWILLEGASAVATLPADDIVIRETQGNVAGTDTLGRILTTRAPRPRPGITVTGASDSLALVLVERSTGRADTVAQLRRMATRSTLVVDAEGRETASSFDRLGVMPTEEVATIFPDGAIAVARLSPFRIDWRLPNGSWVRGDSLRIRPVRVDARQKLWYMKAIAGNDKPQAPETLHGWPAEIPPFYSAPPPLIPSPDGRLLIRRSKDADHQQTRYLVVDRRGQVSGEISLASNTTILGFGRSHAFVVQTDADGIQTLSRHAWPD